MHFLGLEGVLSLTGFPIHTHTPNCVRIRKSPCPWDCEAQGPIQVVDDWVVFFSSTGCVLSPLRLCPFDDRTKYSFASVSTCQMWRRMFDGSPRLLTGLLPHWYTSKEAWVELPRPHQSPARTLATPAGWLACFCSPEKKSAAIWGELALREED